MFFTVGAECRVTVEHPVRWPDFRAYVSSDSSNPNDCMWSLPTTFSVPEPMMVETLCNFVLDRHHSVLVGHVQCITLGHNFSHPSVKHPVWGTDMVVNFLRRQNGFPLVISSAPVSETDILMAYSAEPNCQSAKANCQPSH